MIKDDNSIIYIVTDMVDMYLQVNTISDEKYKLDDVLMDGNIINIYLLRIVDNTEQQIDEDFISSEHFDVFLNYLSNQYGKRVCVPYYYFPKKLDIIQQYLVSLR